jgi:hypothetical protein
MLQRAQCVRWTTQPDRLGTHPTDSRARRRPMTKGVGKLRPSIYFNCGTALAFLDVN